MCVLVSKDKTVITIVSQLWGAWHSLTFHIKIFWEREKGGVFGKRPEWFRGGGRPKHHCQAPHTGDEPSLISDATGEIAGYVGAKGPCVGSALNAPPTAGPKRQALSAKPSVQDPLVVLSGRITAVRVP